MKKKGFTLIELIAVIIILVIIALIAIPMVFNVIEDSKKSAGESEANMILKGITDYCEQEKMGISKTTYCKDETTLKENLDKIVNLGNLDKNDINVSLSNNKITSLNLKSNNNQYGLLDNKMQEYSKENNLIDLLLKQYNPENTVGLLKDGDTTRYYYKGTNEQVANNFLWYGGHQWRVLEFDINTKTLKLITQQPLTAIQSAQYVWTDKTSYENSYVNKWLNGVNSNSEYDGVFYNSLRENVQKNIVATIFNIGTTPDISKVTTTKKVGLLDVKQYTNAGGLNSYLNIKDTWFLGNTSKSSDGFFVWTVGNNGKGRYYTASGAAGIRPVITISDVIIHEGDGTLKKNYKMSENVNNISLAQVGDYIKVPYNGLECNDNFCMFRVVRKDNDRIKVVLNGLLKTKSEWANDATDYLQDTDLVYSQVLNPFVGKIYSKYLMPNNIFGVGDYPFFRNEGQDYNIVQSQTITSNIGLPVVGEMFSGNDIDVNNDSKTFSKTFVDSDLIENPTVGIWYWPMNRLDSSMVRNINWGGVMDGVNPFDIGGVRPVIFLNNNLEFKSGDGSPSSPFELQ